MTAATALFFMAGSLTCLNDLFIPYLKSTLELTYIEGMLVEFAFFSSYFIFSYSVGWLVDRRG